MAIFLLMMCYVFRERRESWRWGHGWLDFQYKTLDNKHRNISSVPFMCTGGGSTDNKQRRKLQVKFYFLCAVSISDVTTVSSSNNTLAPQRLEVPILNTATNDDPIFGPFEMVLRTWVLQFLVCMFPLEVYRYIK